MATGKQIDRARSGATAIESPGPLESLFNDEAIAKLPLSRKIAYWLFFGLAVIGIIIFRGAVSLEWTVAALAMTAVGIAGSAMALRRKRRDGEN